MDKKQLELINQLRKGDPKAYKQVCQESFSKLLGFQYKNNISDYDINVFIREALEELVLNLRKPDFKLTCIPTTYIYGVVKRMAWSHNRKASKFDSLDDEKKRKEIGLDKLQATSDTTDEKNEKESLLFKIKKALEQLSNNQKEVITKFFLEEKSHREITQELGLKKGSSRVMLNRGLRKLKSLLN